VPGGIINDQNYPSDLARVGSVQQLGVESLPRFKYGRGSDGATDMGHQAS
jgi:hypothetical protein